MTPSPRNLGVSVLVTNDLGRVLVGKRGPACPRGAHLWALPGGWVQDETVNEAAVREVLEETGVAVRGLAGPRGTAAVFACTDHYPNLPHVTLWVHARADRETEPRVLEPTKCLEWKWVHPGDVPGSYDPESPQFEWLPLPLFRQWLPEVFGGS